MQSLFRLTPQFGQFITFGKSRQNGLVFGRPESAALGNLDRVLKRLRQIGKQRHHFFGGFQPVVWRKPAPVFFIEVAPLGNANERIMGAIIVFGSKIGLIGCHKRQVAGIGQFHESVFNIRRRTIGIALQFNVKTV